MSTELWFVVLWFYLMFGMLFFFSELFGQFGRDLYHLSSREAVLNAGVLFAVSMSCWWIVWTFKRFVREDLRITTASLDSGYDS